MWVYIHVKVRGQMYIQSTFFLVTGSFTGLNLDKQNKLLAQEPIPASPELGLRMTPHPNPHFTWVRYQSAGPHPLEANTSLIGLSLSYP